MKRAAIYLRVSSDRQAREGDSIPAQRDALRKYIADRPDLTFAGEYLDDGISGTKADRDELQRLLEDVEQDRIDLILFVKLDRWFRSVRHYTATQEILDRHGVGWTAIWEPIYDTTTPAGRLIVNQMMSIAQFEAENTGQRIRQVQAYKVAQGEVISGSTPPGYSIENKRLVINEEAESVRQAFRAYDRTGSLSETMRICAGLPGLPRAKSPFKNMLKNTLYIGKHPRNDHFCEPIIPEDLFERVNKGLRMNVKKSQKNVYIFSGLLRCGTCGCSMGGGTRRRQRGNGKLEITPQYRCAKHYTRVPAQCGNAKILSESVLENYLIERIRGEIGALVYDVQAAPIRDTRAQAAALEAKLKRLKDLYVEELISLEEYKADREAYTRQLEELRAESPAGADLDGLRELLKTDFEDLYYDMNKLEKRRFWRAILKEIRFNEDRTIDLYF